MSKYNLPRGYLSYSAFSLWQKSQKQFRERYYENAEPFETPETIFGKTIARHLEDGGLIEGIEKTKSPEYRIELELEEGLKLLGYLDDFDEEKLKIREFKTGHLDPKGNVPWDDIKVRKHKQLVFYNLLVFLKFGDVDPVATLQWLETRFKEDTMEFQGHILKAKSRSLELTGKVETFNREIKDWERDNLVKEILQAADDITKDYTLWQSKNK